MYMYIREYKIVIDNFQMLIWCHGKFSALDSCMLCPTLTVHVLAYAQDSNISSIIRLIKA